MKSPKKGKSKKSSSVHGWSKNMQNLNQKLNFVATEKKIKFSGDSKHKRALNLQPSDGTKKCKRTTGT